MNREMAEIIRDQTPLILAPSATVQEACRRMYSRKVGAVLVTNDKGALVGIFTGRDAVRVLAQGRDATSTPLREVMTRKPETMKPQATAIDALRLMRDGGFRHVPVVEDGGHRLPRGFPRARARPDGPGNRVLGTDALTRRQAGGRSPRRPARPCPRDAR